MSDPPWVNPQTWVDNSSFLHLDHIDSPLLIAVGTHGIPGEQAQAEQLFAGLRRLNRTTELRHYNGLSAATDSQSVCQAARMSGCRRSW
jgi:dipeptidyl aminopeptidase/acylaminoacyl peptidase